MNSRFVSLTDYCIVEYMATPLGDVSPTLLSSTFYKVDNEYTNSRQIYNTDGFRSTTRNSRDLSVVSLGGSKAIYLDTTLVPIYVDYDSQLTQTEISSSYSSNLVIDKVRLHFASGFNFTEVSNIIFGVKQTLNDLTQLQLANVLLDSQTAQEIFTYNTRPLFLGNTTYDRYAEITIPSIPWLDADFDQFGSASFEYQITDGIGFVKNAPITVFLAEAAYEEYNAPNNITYDRYQINNYYESPISQGNRFDALALYIEEAADGDYIEFFATWNGGFPESLIASLNESGPDQDWILIHQLQVYEHVGGTDIASGNQLIYQENNFDLPLYYRPILRNAGFATAMSIDYTLRLLNKKTGEQVIKTGSLSIINPNKYGLSLAKITLPEGPQSMKVYNKIVQKNFETGSIFSPKSSQIPATSNASANSGTSVIKVEVKVPEYVSIKQTSIRLSQKNALNQVGNEEAVVVYGQGRLILPIDPTDNLIKFTVYQANSTNRTTQSKVNLNNNSEFKLVFGKTNDFVFAPVTDATLTSPSNGEICFRIPKEKAKLLLDTTDTQFYIALVSKLDGTETLLYTGSWTPSANYADQISAEEDALSALANETLIAELQQQLSKLTEENANLTESLQAANATSQQTASSANQINTAAAAGVNSSQMD
jgi:hypothetical protein